MSQRGAFYVLSIKRATVVTAAASHVRRTDHGVSSCGLEDAATLDFVAVCGGAEVSHHLAVLGRHESGGHAKTKK